MGRVKAGGRLEEAWREGASTTITAFGLLQCESSARHCCRNSGIQGAANRRINTTISGVITGRSQVETATIQRKGF